MKVKAPLRHKLPNSLCSSPSFTMTSLKLLLESVTSRGKQNYSKSSLNIKSVIIVYGWYG